MECPQPVSASTSERRQVKTKTRGRKKGEGDTTLPGVLRTLLALPIKQIDADRVRQWLQEEVRRPTVAMSALVRLRAFLNWWATKPEYKGQAHADACDGTDAVLVNYQDYH